MNTKLMGIVLAAVVAVSLAAGTPEVAGPPAAGQTLFGTFQAEDALEIRPDASKDAQAMLDELAWEGKEFQVVCKPEEKGAADAIVTFPSPRPTGDEVNDQVVMEWYVARDERGQPVNTSAMLVLHILDGRMAVARLIARTFAFSGTHAFVMHLPHYGRRRGPKYQGEATHFLVRVHQGIADARRARDAIAALPYVQGDQIGIEGTSLGGFVASMAAAIDDAFDPVFIVLAGADIHGMLMHGQKDAATVRRHLAEAGYEGKTLKEMAWRVEPSRLAHRLNPDNTWLFSAAEDQVVPATNARALAAAAGLAPLHHVWMSGNHYSCAIHLPRVTAKMARVIREKRKANTNEK